MTAYAVLGADVSMAVPLIDDEVARACLAISPLSKLGGGLYDAAFDSINPSLNGMGTTRRGTRSPVSRRRVATTPRSVPTPFTPASPTGRWRRGSGSALSGG